MSHPASTRQGRVLLLGWVVPPVVWLAVMQIAYALAPATCTSGRAWLLLAPLAIGAVATVAIGGGIARAFWRRGGEWPGTVDDVPNRESFAAVIAALLALQVVLILIAQAAAVLVVDPCS